MPIVIATASFPDRFQHPSIMRKPLQPLFCALVLLLMVACFWSVDVFAQSVGATPEGTKFHSDGCSWFPDGDYADCCVEHDRSYFFGGTARQRSHADALLYRCVASKGRFEKRIIAPMMWVGVRVGGMGWLPTPFRWGYGKKYGVRDSGRASDSATRPEGRK